MKKYIKASDGSMISFAQKAKRTFRPVTASTSSRKAKQNLHPVAASAKVIYDGVGPRDGSKMIRYDMDQLVADMVSILESLGETILRSGSTVSDSVMGFYRAQVSSVGSDPESSFETYPSYWEHKEKQLPRIETMREKLEALGYHDPDVWVWWGDDGDGQPCWNYTVEAQDVYDWGRGASSDDSDDSDGEVDDELETFRMAYEDLPWDEYVEFIADYESDVAAEAEQYLAAKGLNSETSVQNGQGSDIIYRNGEVVAQIDYEEELQTLGQLLIDNNLDIDKTAKAFADYVLSYVN